MLWFMFGRVVKGWCRGWVRVSRDGFDDGGGVCVDCIDGWGRTSYTGTSP